MALLVTCECGHRLEAADDQAGQTVPCPQCARPIVLPEPYNPLSTAKYAPSSPAADTAPPPRSGPECPDCSGGGRCRYCKGDGRIQQEFLDRVTGAISGAIGGVFGFLASALGGDPPGGKKIQTRSEKRRAGACPGCEGTGACFACEGTGRNAS